MTTGWTTRRRSGRRAPPSGASERWLTTNPPVGDGGIRSSDKKPSSYRLLFLLFLVFLDFLAFLDFLDFLVFLVFLAFLVLL
jgi:hypothetical protein